jgi:hypothetical protein
MDLTEPESERLRREVEWALRRALDPSDVLPMLHRLTRTAARGTEESLFAHQKLAELLIERHPWRATLHAKRVLAALPDDERAWAVLAACQAMLGNYKYAVSGYQRALESSPTNPSYAHNLGHLLDVALDRPGDAVPWLRMAHEGRSDSPEITASYAHALARTGDMAEAKRVLGGAKLRGAPREHVAMWKWLQKGAPAERALPPLRPPMFTGWARSPALETEPKARNGKAAGALDAALARGLARLPVGPTQRARAAALARDAAQYCLADSNGEGAPSRSAMRKPDERSDRSPGGEDSTDEDPIETLMETRSLAAAVAYAIVYVDHVPLTQAEVAACFRVSASALRARFKDLRLRLDLTPGDARYATLRRS